MKQKILFVLSLIFGLMFINAGFNKFFDYMPMPEDISPEMLKAMGAFMTIGWLMPLIGAAEVVGGLLMIIPKTRALGAIISLPIMVGIVLTSTLTDPNPTGISMALVMLAVNLWVIYENREKYMPMVRA